MTTVPAARRLHAISTSVDRPTVSLDPRRLAVSSKRISRAKWHSSLRVMCWLPSRSPAALRLKIYQNMDLQMAPLHCTNAQENRETWSGLPWPCWGARRFLPATASGRGPYSARDLGTEVERHAFDPIRGQQQSPRLPGRAAVTREATECGRSSRRASTTRPRPTSRGAQRRFPGL